VRYRLECQAEASLRTSSPHSSLGALVSPSRPLRAFGDLIPAKAYKGKLIRVSCDERSARDAPYKVDELMRAILQ
jgi:hypothetical protein